MKKTSKSTPESTQTRLLPIRLDKTLDWLEKSRDSWKDKCLQTKLGLKMKTLSAKRLRGGRDKWKQEAKEASIKIKQMEEERENLIKEIEKLNKKLIMQTSYAESLKKKS